MFSVHVFFVPLMPIRIVPEHCCMSLLSVKKKTNVFFMMIEDLTTNEYVYVENLDVCRSLRHFFDKCQICVQSGHTAVSVL
jgi:hypothetical protein